MSLDELPQLINILRGEMSIVGPRPLQIRDSEKLRELDSEAYFQRLQVMPGLTGPWQIGGRSEVDYSKMVTLDLDYVQNWSLSLDMWIIFRTFVVVLLGRGAYSAQLVRFPASNLSPSFPAYRSFQLSGNHRYEAGRNDRNPLRDGASGCITISQAAA